MRHRLLNLTTALVLAAGLLISTTVAAEGPAWTYKPDKGFIDDPIAFSPDGATLVYFHSDSATFTKMVLVKVKDGFKTDKEIKLEDPTMVPRRVAFTPDSKKVVLIYMDAYKGINGALIFDVATGKIKRKLEPSEHLALVKVKGKQAIARTKLKKLRKGGAWHRTSYLDTQALKRLLMLKTKVKGDMTLDEPPVRLLNWDPGHFAFIGLRPGEYDKKKDIRLPDVSLRFNLLTNKETWAEAPKDLPAWELAIKMRYNHPGQLRYTEVSGDLKKLYYVDQKNGVTELQGKVPWDVYDHESLKQWESWDRETLYFSLTVDPVNPAAVKRKKEDQERVDIYSLDRAGAIKLVGKVDTDRKKGRVGITKFGWSVGKEYFVYLKKLRGFARGGKELKVFKVEK